jgi:TRAP-type C4-dicarboxylate transport system substrate-binding protein
VWLGTSGREYWQRLTPKERKDLLDLMRKSRGRRSNLSKKEQDRVIELLDKVRRGGH